MQSVKNEKNWLKRHPFLTTFIIIIGIVIIWSASKSKDTNSSLKDSIKGLNFSNTYSSNQYANNQEDNPCYFIEDEAFYGYRQHSSQNLPLNFDKWKRIMKEEEEPKETDGDYSYSYDQFIFMDGDKTKRGVGELYSSTTNFLCYLGDGVSRSKNNGYCGMGLTEKQWEVKAMQNGISYHFEPTLNEEGFYEGEKYYRVGIIFDFNSCAETGTWQYGFTFKCNLKERICEERERTYFDRLRE
ncbi:MAG: hypothetical protein AABX83_01655 [Nanoarchaeota archaeon]